MSSHTALPGLSFTAIDFETANSDRASACAVGAARVRDGLVVETFTSLIEPPTGSDSFASMNVAIHGIDSDAVAGAPRWDVVFKELDEFVSDDVLVAHNAPFDRSVLQGACSALDIDWPENEWFDTLHAARRLLTLPSYSLPFVAEELGLDASQHHVAQADALQAAGIVTALARQVGVESLAELRTHVGAGAFYRPAVDDDPADEAGSAAAVGAIVQGEGRPLAGHHVVFTGRLDSTTRPEALALVEGLGGIGQKGLNRATTMVVTGDFDARTFRPGASMSRKLEQAMRLVETGRRIEIVTEADFLDLISISQEQLASIARARQAARAGWLPGYVVEQANALADEDLDYWAWFRRSLRSPLGRASGHESCVRCGDTIEAKAFWIYRDRHVCSGDCNDGLKRAAKRAWSRAGLI